MAASALSLISAYKASVFSESNSVIISLFENLGKIPYLQQNLPFWIYVFFNNFWSKGPIKLKFGTSTFFGLRSPKITLRIHKNKPVVSHFKFLLNLTGSGTGKVCDTTIIQKKFFSSKTKDINLTFYLNWDWVLF